MERKLLGSRFLGWSGDSQAEPLPPLALSGPPARHDVETVESTTGTALYKADHYDPMGGRRDDVLKCIGTAHR